MAAQFEVISSFQPAGDRPQAIAKLVEGLRDGRSHARPDAPRRSERIEVDLRQFLTNRMFQQALNSAQQPPPALFLTAQQPALVE